MCSPADDHRNIARRPRRSLGAIVVVDVSETKTQKTPRDVIANCQRRLRLYKQAAAARARATAADTDEGRCAAQDEPEPSGANGGRGSIGFSRFAGAWVICPGSVTKGFAQG